MNLAAKFVHLDDRYVSHRDDYRGYRIRIPQMSYVDPPTTTTQATTRRKNSICGVSVDAQIVVCPITIEIIV